MNQTIKHICIFLVFLVCVYFWKEAEPFFMDYAKHVIPRQIRTTCMLFFWSTMVVAIWHLLFFYMGKMSDKVVYLTSAIIVSLTLVMTTNGIM